MKWAHRNIDAILLALFEHVAMVAIALSISFAIAMALGVWTARRPAIYGAVMSVAAILYTIPSLALFALLIPLVGLGPVPAVIGLVAYSILILTQNIATGLRQVPADVLEAATGMGYSPMQRMLRIELPLALPVIVAGLRIAAVTQIGVATVAAYINAGGLGTIIFAGINQRFPEKIMVGALLASALAVTCDLTLARIEKRLRARAAG